MKVVAYPKYVTAHGVIEFAPVDDMPGFTHQVVVNGARARLWVPPAQRTDRKSTAVFYIRVWCALQEGRDKYYYVDRNQDPALPKAQARAVLVGGQIEPRTPAELEGTVDTTMDRSLAS